MNKFIVVWRERDGAAVQTFANPDRSPRVFDEGLEPSQHTPEATAVSDELVLLLSSREAFEPRRVTLLDAEKLLGWDISTESTK